MRWTLLVDPSGRPGWHNMAVDQALLDLAAGEGRAFLRIYRWEPFCLSFGRNEPALKRYDRAAIERLGLDTVRRPTGGRAVWHADEVTYAVAAPIHTFGTLAETYQRIHETLAEALQSLGFPAELASPPARSQRAGRWRLFRLPCRWRGRAGGTEGGRQRPAQGGGRLPAARLHPSQRLAATGHAT